ncbi:hypothetical protein DFJ74DRAFT_681994 [Hyaloraphidium curvatum]|nr:hypothetical protein DFJ74DRAFT_681994 [Hyaloraphidium curvatum]
MNVPIFDWKELQYRSDLRPGLRKAVVDTGYLYLVRHGIPTDLLASLADCTRAVFAIPMEEKLRTDIANSPHFYGFNPMVSVLTQSRPDVREHFDFGDDRPSAWTEGQDLWRRMRPGPNQWPSHPGLPPEFRATVLSYLEHMANLAREFTRVLALSLGLSADAFDSLEGGGRIKLCRYPGLDEIEADVRQRLTVKGSHIRSGLNIVDEDVVLGVGEHRDAWLTFTLGVPARDTAGKATDKGLSGLQIRQSPDDPFTPVPDIPDGCDDPFPLIVNFGHLFTRLTHGCVSATLHRVVLGNTARYSVPYFADIDFEADLSLGWHIGREADADGDDGGKQSGPPPPPPPGQPPVHIGEAYLVNRCRSHQRVGWRWYPQLMEWLQRTNQLGDAA